MALNISHVVARIVLCELSQGLWNVTRKHKAQTSDTNSRIGTTDEARVLVKLTEAPSYKAIVSNNTAAYAVHQKMTLPGASTGIRVLPVGKRMDYSDRMREFADENARLVPAFLAEYPSIRSSAPYRLNPSGLSNGGLYDPRHWPTVDKVAECFRFETRILPVPTEGDWLSWVEESARAAENQLQEDLRKALSTVVERCGSDGKLYATVFSNLQSVLDLCPSFESNATIAHVAMAAREIANQNAESIRDNLSARTSTADKARDLLASLTGDEDSTFGLLTEAAA